ncbi:hypothetical protein K1719_012801 [Acacia pycnantha]|nr:hypothetical protein K1719_012801 [Acacia pycnantha]
MNVKTIQIPLLDRHLPVATFSLSAGSLSSSSIHSGLHLKRLAQGRSPRVCADSGQVMDQFTTTVENAVPTIVEVDAGNRSYPIYIGSGLLDKPELLQRHAHGKKRVLVVTNNTIAPLYLDKVADALTRGNPNISVENIPTTVVAQVDSSVRGKTGIHDRYSIIDAVCQPQSVLIDTDTLNTLPDRELASGFAEVIKYGLIRDAQFFEWLEKNMQSLMARDPSALAYAKKRSCENKAEVISLDEKQTGLGATLNLGHTFGHAIETKGGYGQWLHGEAVAAGIVVAVDLSHRLGWIDDSSVRRVHVILKQANLPTAPPENMTVDMFKSVMMIMMIRERVDEGSTPKLIIPRGPLGNCVCTRDYDRNALDATLLKITPQRKKNTGKKIKRHKGFRSLSPLKSSLTAMANWEDLLATVFLPRQLDYLKVFEGFENLDTVVPYQELFAESNKKDSFSKGASHSFFITSSITWCFRNSTLQVAVRTLLAPRFETCLKRKPNPEEARSWNWRLTNRRKSEACLEHERSNGELCKNLAVRERRRRRRGECELAKVGSRYDVLAEEGDTNEDVNAGQDVGPQGIVSPVWKVASQKMTQKGVQRGQKVPGKGTGIKQSRKVEAVATGVEGAQTRIVQQSYRRAEK